jgi:hypothetical protein
MLLRLHEVHALLHPYALQQMVAIVCGSERRGGKMKKQGGDIQVIYYMPSTL